ncbi:MAG: Gfo/Idh/MocA family oxidoreductase [Kiritimatiellia bacterium]|nr:Gfo/Idh/MocA family oxidoreductase [Kiritimatiellia bacterium]MDP6631681.1 Gfo/Idh/MocA family oxidoreductase [Kiritimatiellia bacterium]MDP6810779.1 Gfo/Idh/MocA family oxidoreductase [Kiritimatiellia bacterium]MDP7022654.1 Gfo/Idh/MocA family oxidoreductase [Kiritimatiellia bacterium]
MATRDTIGVGVIGCGMISGAYLSAAKTFPVIDVVGCADVMMDRAREKAEEFGTKAMTNEEIYADPAIDIVVNLSPPLMHSEINLAALEAGKHVYSEKPFGVDAEDAARVIQVAREKNLRVGSAPDTFLGGGLQTCRKLIDDGWIGSPISATAIFMGRGPETWGQAPFFYDYGAGPMLDLGPYYITALVHLFGPAKSVVAMTKKGSEYRTFAGEVAPQYQDTYKPYDRYPVNVTTHLTGVVEFHSGVTATVITSFEAFAHTHPSMEVYGDQGSMTCPDPNTFGGPVRVLRNGDKREWQDVPLTHIYSDNSRSLGVADMAQAILNNREHRCNGDLASHVLEIMLAFDRASQDEKKIVLETTCDQPAPFPLGMMAGVLD